MARRHVPLVYALGGRLVTRPQTAPAAPVALTGVAGVHNALAPAEALGGGAVGASALGELMSA